ncbi:hypothetical protein LTR36_006932 [Oleoguttula mirabilis]|uniref:Cytochrome P450 6A1 n=1 Tax=Oleoguttula mirabilis TaxID=1507867 RepID=A0AAV9JBH0_9PEZI|nr:hypothetical protein LTR36_006932 [Oleoguttula mirabilis]
MGLTSAVNMDTSTVAIAVGSVAILLSIFLYLFSKPAFPKNAPAWTTEAWPVIGSMQFFTRRWDFMQKQMQHSKTGNFTFRVGQHDIVGISGREARKIFLESKALGFSEGYSALLGGSPEVKKDNNPFAETNADSGFSAYFNKRLVNMLKGNQLKNGLPQLLQDARANLDKLAADKSGVTDPFDSIYRMVFQFTMRTVACKEIADDPPLLARTLKMFEDIEGTATPLSIMYPWLPLPAKAKRTYAGAQLYMILKRVVDARTKEGRREDDALQYLMDQGDNITDIITFVLGALFAGQLNSGINAAWILVYMASKPYWLDRVREEVVSVASRYCPDDSIPLKERLMHVPIEAWEGEFPIIDICLKDTIRLQMSGTAFRKNFSGKDVPLNKAEVIPNDAYVTMAVGDIHYNPEIYANPDEWDPARYMPGREEHKKQEYAWMGWGLARHPCLGMRFAKLENNLIVAFFLAYFDEIKLSDAKGNETTRIPQTDRNKHTAHKPAEKVYLKYKVAA